MNDSESWEMIQKLVSNGAGDLFISQFEAYIKESLTEAQLQPLGELEPVLKNIVASKPDNIKFTLDSIIELSKKGAILGRR